MDAVFMFGDLEPSATGRPSAPEPIDPYSVANVVYAFLSYFVMPILQYLPIALVVSAISIAFRTCTGWVPAAGGPPDLSPPSESAI